MTVADVRAQAELRHARKREFAAAKGAKAQSGVGDRPPRKRRRDAPRLMDKTHRGPDVGTKPEVVAHAVKRCPGHSGFKFDRHHSGGGDVARHRVSHEPELKRQMIVAPPPGARSKAAHWSELRPNTKDVSDRPELRLTAR